MFPTFLRSESAVVRSWEAKDVMYLKKNNTEKRDYSLEKTDASLAFHRQNTP